jgi:hypothetical protein
MTTINYKVIGLLVMMVLVFTNCSIDEGEVPIVNYETLPIVEVELPPSFIFGERYEIPVLFNYTNSCQSFAGFEVNSTLNERVITVVATVTFDNCIEEEERTQQNLNFLVASNGTYVFKFFTGLDTDNEPTYLEYTIPVEE